MNIRSLGIFCAAGVLAAAGSASGAIFASGTLAGSDGTLIPTSGNWAAWANPTLNWSIDLTGNLFTYSYEFDNGNTGGQANLSHIAIEVSDNFGLDDIFLGTTAGWELGLDGSSPHDDGAGSPLNAMKWQVDGSSVTVHIVTQRVPVWGDVFLKDGSVDGANAGYFLPDPAGAVAGLNITGYGWLGVPDTDTIPAPGAIVLAAMSGVVALRRRRN